MMKESTALKSPAQMRLGRVRSRSTLWTTCEPATITRTTFKGWKSLLRSSEKRANTALAACIWMLASLMACGDPTRGYYVSLDLAKSTIESSVDSVIADGSSKADIVVTLMTSKGVLMPDLTVRLLGTPNGQAVFAQPLSSSDPNGQSFGSVSSSHVGDVVIGAYVSKNGGYQTDLSATKVVHFTP